MPQPIILPDVSGLSQGIQQFGQGMGRGIAAIGQGVGAQRGAQRQDQQYQQFTQQFEQAQGDPAKMAMALATGAKMGIPAPVLQGMADLGYKATQQKAFKAAEIAADAAGGFSSPEGRSAGLSAWAKNGGDPIEGFKYFSAPAPGKPSKYDQAMSQAQADDIKELSSDTQGIRSVESNIKWLSDHVNDVGRGQGIFKGNFLYNGKEFTEFRNRGMLVLKGVINTFNRVGALPQAKLEMIIKNYSISPWDTQDQIKGKLSAIHALTEGQAEYMNGLAALSKQHGYREIPQEEYARYKAEYFTRANQMADNLEAGRPANEGIESRPKSNAELLDKLPAGAEKGTQYRDDKNGDLYTFNGKRWVREEGTKDNRADNPQFEFDPEKQRWEPGA